MRIIKAPLRISLFGGGTDLPEYYTEHGSTIISMAINRHIYLVHNGRPTGGYRLSYSEVEELRSLTTARHTLIRQAAKVYGEPKPCTLSIISDVPKGTGLGSSSALAVCIHELLRKDRTEGHMPEQAYAAYELERAVSNCGVQDHLPAVFGGFRMYEIGKDGKAASKPIPQRLVGEIDSCGLLLYTGINRSADIVLRNWRKSTGHLRRIHDLANYVEERIENVDIDSLGKYLQVGWELKRKISGVSSGVLSDQYQIALDAGVLGGKLLGAGGGGCWFFLVKPENRKGVIDALRLTEIPFRVEHRKASSVYA